MQGFKAILFLSLWGMSLLGHAGFAQSQNGQKDSLTAAIHATWAQDWPTARRLAKEGSPIDPLIIDWLRFRGGDGSAEEILTFLERHSDWPGLALMRATGEAKLAVASDGIVLRYFANDDPQTAQGALAFARALQRSGRTERAAAVVQRAWVKMPMPAKVQSALEAEFAQVIAPIHAARLDEMLWQNALEDAARMLALVNAADSRLGQARIALRQRSANVDDLIEAVPDRLRLTPGLVFDRFRYRYNRRDLRLSAENLMRETSQSAAALGRPEAWGEYRLNMARDALEGGRGKIAYDLAANHFISDPEAAAQLEWFSGFIALTAKRDPRRAVMHFTNYLGGVTSQISRARGYYWLARAQREARMTQDARKSFGQAAQFQYTFYGQLAAEKAKVDFDRGLLAPLDAPGLRQNPAIMNSFSFAAGARLLNDGQHSLAERFLTHVTEGLDSTGQAQLARLAIDLDDVHLALRLAKRSASQGLVLPEAYFPIHRFARGQYGVPPALLLAVARRESEFDPTAKSSVGALGMMQLMPKTAQYVAQKHNIALGPEPLDADWKKNVRLGALYLQELAQEFDNNIPLMAAAYNAGPSRARQWIERFGDPRKKRVDPVIWIEQIPFEETRNYVQRVVEGVAIYRAKLGGKAHPVPLSQELKARRFF